ncbi:MAG: MarR family transcriptional regulator [Clostridiales bacterium]|nr:MarR family transcriptional regulator [Clostridiales bacterium]
MEDNSSMSKTDFGVLGSAERIIFKIKSSIHRIFDKSPISIREFLVLKMIRDAEENSDNITSSEISRFFCISRSAVSQFIASLEKREYIERKIVESDKRKTYLIATPKAKAVLDDYKSRFTEILDELSKQMGGERFTQFLALSAEAAEFLEDMIV